MILAAGLLPLPYTERTAERLPGGKMATAEKQPRADYDDEGLLHKLGYAQVLIREMGGFSNFAISFTIISILAGCLTSYFIAFNNGGRVAVTRGWLLVGGFCVVVAIAVGEVGSPLPTAGGGFVCGAQ